jgi:transcription antitermination protein NusB
VRCRRRATVHIDDSYAHPARVIVSEYVDVAHAFVETATETGMVNAVLDQPARRARPGEFA